MKKIAENIVVAVVIIAIFALMLGVLLEGYKEITSLNDDEKKKAFLMGQEFACRGGFERFLVSKRGGWKIQGEEFVKEDKFVSISECRERE